MKKLWIGIVLILLPMLPVFAQGGDPVAPPDGTELPLMELIYNADFTDEAVWPAGTAPNALAFEPTSGGFSVLSTDAQSGIGLAPAIEDIFDNVYTEFEFTVDGCDSGSSALLFSTRLQPGTSNLITTEQYVFVVQCDGSYRSRPITGGAPGIIDTRGSIEDGLDIGETHVMGVLQVGNEITWYFDGQQLASYTGSQMPFDGQMTFGAQSGAGYTVNQWRVWSIESDEEPIVDDDGSISNDNADDPVANREFTDVIYNPDFEPPTDIRYGLHFPIARYVNPNGIGMYNNDDTALMDFPLVNQADYYFEINFVIRACGEDSFVGLTWRGSEDLGSFYVYGIQCDGNFRARAVVDGTAGDILSEGDVGAPLSLGELMAMSVFVRGDTAYLYYNRTLLDTITDDTLIEGIPGILLQSSTAGEKMDIIVTDLGVLGVE
jgi:hypothetical protein